MDKPYRKWTYVGIITLACAFMISTVAIAKGTHQAQTSSNSSGKGRGSHQTNNTRLIIQKSKMSSQKNNTPPNQKVKIFEENSAGKMGMKAAGIANSRYSEIYGGMPLTDNMSHVNIYLTKITPKIKRIIRGPILKSKITFLKTLYSKKQILAIHQKVKQAYLKLKSKGIRVGGNGLDIKTGKERIQVINLTASKKQYLYNKFGKGNIEVQNIKPSDLPQAMPGIKRDDRDYNK